MKNWLALVAILTTLFGNVGSTLHACTTVIVSGRATIDGRPLLWKNRDTWQQQNEVIFDEQGRYSFVGIVNAEATRRVWMGANEAGFCIENSLSKDLDEDDASGVGNGTIIRRALESCATVADFEALLDTTNESGRSTTGNFGVIDNHGGAMMFEVGPDSYRRFNVNDPKVAPNGFLVRANTSISGSKTKRQESLETGYSGERYCRARDLCQSHLDRGEKIDVQFLLQKVARDINGLDLNKASFPQTISTARTLSRNTTVSSVVFQGTLAGEPPACTTMWTILGEPMFSVAVPVWVAPKKISTEMNGIGSSPICDRAIMLRDKNYQHHTERRTEHVFTKSLPLISRQVMEIESKTLRQTLRGLSAWRVSPSPTEQWQVHQQSATDALRGLAQLCQITSEQSVADRRENEPKIDFKFDDPNDTRLADTKDSAGKGVWDGGLTDCTIQEGLFRLRRNDRKPINRYVDLNPDVRIKADDGKPKSHRGWIVARIAGWNLRGKTLNEVVRIGFTSRTSEHLHVAGVQIKRTGEDEVTIDGIAFGDGGTKISTDRRWPAKQPEPLELVLELDKVDGNSGEGDAGGSYRIFLKTADSKTFKQLGEKGKVRRLRNGNHMHLHVEGFFAATEEKFDIDRVYFTTTNPIR